MSNATNSNPAGNPTFTIKGVDPRLRPAVSHGTDPDDSGAVGRIEDLPRKLVQVPKTEVDEQRV